jgi:hypothetical protein
MGNANGGDFDQAKWCAYNAGSVNREDIQATFRYVQRTHPLFGCAKPMFALPVWNGTESTETLAKCADAVAILCCEPLGRDKNTIPSDGKVSANTIRGMNATAIANLAHIALHHSDSNVRAAALVALDDWRRTKQTIHSDWINKKQ